MAEAAPGAGTVAPYVEAAVPVAAPGDCAGAVRAGLVGHRFASVDPVHVVADGRRLLGAVRLAALLAAEDATPLSALMEADWPTVPVTATREAAASLAIRARVPALAVLDRDGAFLGAVSATAVMEIMRDEHLEDLHHMAGILSRSAEAQAAMTAPPYRRALFRLPWLLAGLAGSAAATGLMAGAEAALSAHIAVAFFVPAIVYMADAIGTQTEAVAVRGLSLNDNGSLRLLAGEIGTGTLLGVALGAVALGAVWWVFGDLRLVVAVAGALAVAGTVATSVGFLLPWGFQRLGLDAAQGAGPIATVIQDVLSLAVYLGFVRLLMG
jgi:magnesium transporter